MSTEAFALFVVGALFLAAMLILSGMSNRRAERRDLDAARAREAAARQEAIAARENRATWEAKLAAQSEAQRDAIVAFEDPRGLADGLGRIQAPAVEPSHRFARDLPATFTA